MKIIILELLVMLTTNKAVNSRVCWFASHLVDHLSVEHTQNYFNYSSQFDYSIAQTKGLNETCSETTDYCYSLWKEIHHNYSLWEIIILSQGCWKSIGKQDCENNNCITSGNPIKALNNTNFCCCKGDFCNGNVTHLHFNEKPTVLSNHDKTNKNELYIIFFVICIVFFILVVSFSPLLMLLIRFSVINIKKKNVANYSNSMHLIENGIVKCSKFSCDNFKLKELLGQGRYGCVWQCNVGNEEFAVKIFQSHHRQFFFNELDIYCTPLMNHPSILSYFGFNERISSNGNTEYLLFLSLAKNGTVQNYLRSHVLEWSSFCNMALSIAKGVAYLHASIRIGDTFKPCINHRDLNTQNILVKEDLSCVICDLGFATKTIGSKYYYNGEEQNAEIKSIHDVGTLRYMAPEVLEGAVDLRNCETALKQIDIYALGIILWELSIRCLDFYCPGIECPPYQLPFEDQLDHPTFDQMKNLICIQKARPLFPDSWHDSCAVRLVKETIEDCWDQDGEARLSAICVEERFYQLSKKYKGQKVKYSNHLISPCATDYPEKNLHLRKNTEWDSFYDGDSVSNTSSDLIGKTFKNMEANYTEPSASTKSTNFCLALSPTENSNIGSENELPSKKNSQISFLQNISINRLTPKKLNLLKSTYNQKRMTWSKFKKIFKGKSVNDRMDRHVKNSLVFNENVIDLTTPVTLIGSKFETEVLLNNGKFETKINVNDDSSKRYKNRQSDSSDVRGTCLGTQIRKRPTTLPIIKNTDFTALKMCKKKNYSFKKNIRSTEKFRIHQNSQRLKGKEKHFSLETHSWDGCVLNNYDSLNELKELKCKQAIVKPDQSIIEKTNKNLLMQPESRRLKEKNFDKVVNRIKPSVSIDNEEFVKFNDSFINCVAPKNEGTVEEKRKNLHVSKLSLDDDRIMSGSRWNETLFNSKKKCNRQRKTVSKFLSLENIRYCDLNQRLENIY